MKRYFFLLCAVLMVFPVFAGGGGEKKDSAGSPKEVRLSAVFPGLGRFKPMFDDFFVKFAASELTKKNIKVVIDAEYPAESTLLQTRFASGEYPDIFTTHVASAPMLEKGGYLPDLSNEAFVSKLFPGVKSSVTVNGKVVGLPLESFAWSYLYNKKIFRDNGVTPPNTLTELRSVINKLKAAGVIPFQLPYREAYFAGWTAQVPLCAIAAQKEKNFYTNMDRGTGSFQTIADAGWLDIIDLVIANGPSRPLEYNTDDGIANFANGQGAMMITGPWYSDSILSANPNFELGLAALPIDDNPQNTVVMLAVSTCLSASPSGKNFDITKDFIAFFLDDSVTNDFFNSCKFNQVATNQKINSYPWTEEGLTYVAAGRSYNEHPFPDAFGSAVGPAVQMYYTQQIDKKGFVAEMNRAWKESLELE
jgi:raffinose/stachyose/melibiose transport system substrate-binding protein